MTPAATALASEAHVWFISLREDVRARGAAACRAAARAALDRVVATYAPEAHVVHRAGRRPEVRGAPLHVSLAHTSALAVAAITRAVEIGVDVEPVRAAPPRAVLAQLLTDRETAAVSALQPSARGRAFTRAWVRKEAVLKAAGVGLSLDPRWFEVGIDRPPKKPVTLPGGQVATVVDLAVVGHEAAVAFVGAAAPIVRVRSDSTLTRTGVTPLPGALAVR